MATVTIRQENESDFAAVNQILEEAFGQPDEAKLVALLRGDQAFVPELSLVAELGNEVVGHILFTKINIVSDNGAKRQSLALAPMAVLPAHQNSGIGTALVNSGLDAAGALGYTSVIVLGHPAYYPRFGFRAASEWGIRAPFDVPSEVFMALELKPGSLQNTTGVVEYAAPFNQV